METIKRWYLKFIGCVVPRKLKTHKEEISFPSEIMEDILSRLPVKSILRFRSVSKPWLSLISTPTFTKLQLTNATVDHRTALFIFAYDASTHKRYFLSAANDGGSVTHLMTTDLPLCSRPDKKPEHLSGLVSLISMGGFGSSICIEALVVNPSTRKIFKIPDLTPIPMRVRHFFGFDESRNEHKILGICVDLPHPTVAIEFIIFSMSSYSWRKIDVTGDTRMNSWFHISINTSSVCVNSIIYLLILRSLENLTCESEILVFDLTTEKFSIVKVPQDAVLRATRHSTFGEVYPYIIKINGCIGVVCHGCVLETNQMHIWILQQDYENCVWVRETVTFPVSWITLGCPFPMDSVNMDEVIFSLNKLSSNVIHAPIYNIKSGCFRWVQFTLDHPFLCSETVEFSQIKCYVESMLPL